MTDPTDAPHPEIIARILGALDGHVVTVRHEVSHVNRWCTGRGLDYGHSHADVWGAQGVVWRREDGT